MKLSQNFIVFVALILFLAGCQNISNDSSQNTTNNSNKEIFDDRYVADLLGGLKIIAQDTARSLTQEKDTSAPIYTQEDYDKMRKDLPYEPFTIDYENLYDEDGYLDIDQTAGKLERYLSWALMGYREAREIPNVLQDDDLLFQSACFATKGFSSEDHVMLEGFGGAYSLTPKEHLDATAKYLYGNDCTIHYSSLEKQGFYQYFDEYGLAHRWGLVKNGLAPTIVAYDEYNDHFQVIVVFLTWHNMLTEDYDYCYVNETADNYEDKYINLTKESAIEFCNGIQPDKYSIRINKGEGERLYLQSILKID